MQTAHRNDHPQQASCGLEEFIAPATRGAIPPLKALMRAKARLCEAARCCLIDPIRGRAAGVNRASTVRRFDAWGFVEHAKIAAEGTQHHFGRVAFLAVLLP